MNIAVLKKIIKILKVTVIAVLIANAIVLTLPVLKIGGLDSYVVLSGSMEPSIKTGSIVVTLPKDKYEEGDVITFAEAANVETNVTHRVISLQGENPTLYETKGDANETADLELVDEVNVFGRVLFSVPLLGYVVSFAQTQLGIIFLIVLPAFIIIYGEVNKIKEEITKRFTKEENEKEE